MNIFQKFFQLSKQKGHGYHFNYENQFKKNLTSRPFSRGGSHFTPTQSDQVIKRITNDYSRVWR